MDYLNIDLNSDYEKSLNIISSLSFETLLLEIHCNIKEINEKTVMEQFEIDLNNIINESREIMLSNLKNIVEHSIKERNSH